MEIENYKCFSLTNKGEVTPLMQLKARFGRVDLVLKFFREIRPEDLNIYVKELKNKLDDVVGDYRFNPESFDWESIRTDLVLITNFPELENSLFQYICKTINLPENYTEDQGKIELLYYDVIKVGERVSYYLVRTFIDIYGKKEGTKIYKEIAPPLIKEMKERHKTEEPEDPKTKTILDLNKGSIESWCKSGLADFSYYIFDDYKIVYRFDKCLIPEVLKEFNDPDVAYLASCYHGDFPGRNEGDIIHMRRTQTLQHSEFCDELYWNNYVHPDTEQPSLDFTKNIGKNKE